MQKEDIQNASREPLTARDNSCCFACGPENPRGLRLTFAKGERGEMSASWTPDPTTEGFSGIVHGGIVSTVLDESMAKAVTAAGIEAVTAEIRVRFRRHVEADKPVRICGWINEVKKRMINAEATLHDEDGVELAHAWAVFLMLR